MSIIYTVITRNKKTVLCEYTEHNGNFQQISLHLLNKISFDVNQIAIEYDDFKFYFKNENLIKEFNSTSLDNIIIENINNNYVTFLCLVNKEIESEDIIFEYLETIKNSFYNFYNLDVIEKSFAYSLKEFIDVLKNERKKFNVKLKKRKNTDSSRKRSDFFKSEIAVTKTSSEYEDENLLVKPTKKVSPRNKKIKKCLIITISVVIVIAAIVTLVLVLGRDYN